VEEGASVTESILCDRVIIRKGAVVGRGCIISFGCIIAANMKVPPYSRITMSNTTEDDGFSDDESSEPKDTANDMEGMGLNSEDFVSALLSEHSLIFTTTNHSLMHIYISLTFNAIFFSFLSFFFFSD